VQAYNTKNGISALMSLTSLAKFGIHTNASLANATKNDICTSPTY
jgi:hypothetical protein